MWHDKRFPQSIQSAWVLVFNTEMVISAVRCSYIRLLYKSNILLITQLSLILIIFDILYISKHHQISVHQKLKICVLRD